LGIGKWPADFADGADEILYQRNLRHLRTNKERASGAAAISFKLNNRKLLDGVLEVAGIAVEDRARRGTVLLRAIDKLDRLAWTACRRCWARAARMSRAISPRARASPPNRRIAYCAFVAPDAADMKTNICARSALLIASSKIGAEGLNELEQIVKLLQASGYGPDRVIFDTGGGARPGLLHRPVWEGELTGPVTNEAGEEIVFGSIASGGRYDDLVARFTGQRVPAAAFPSASADVGCAARPGNPRLRPWWW